MTDPDPQAESTAEPTVGEDENHRRFREALERKQAGGGAAAKPHHPGSSHIPSSNTKRQKTFRRKSGG